MMIENQPTILLNSIVSTGFGALFVNAQNFPRGCPYESSKIHIVRSFTDIAECTSCRHRHERHPSLLLFKLAEAGLSNPIRDPRFLVSVSGVLQSAAFAFGVPHNINAFYRYTMSSADPSHPLVIPFPLHAPG